MPVKNGIKRAARTLGLGNAIQADSSYEPEVCANILKTVRPGWVCADIGAHHGVITALLAKLVGRTGLVAAFEAHPQNAAILRENIDRSGYRDRIKVENKAVADGASDKVTLFAGRKRSSSEWNVVGRDLDGVQTAPELQIPAVSVDQYFAGQRVDFVKIDVEGGAAAVLNGMSRTLRESRPVVLLEFHNEREWNARQLLVRAGYDILDMKGKKVPDGPEVPRIYHCLARPVRQLIV